MTRFQALGLIAMTAVVFLIAVAFRVAMLDHPPIYDELYQMIPALEHLRSGTFRVLDGVYDRGAIFTRLVAWSVEQAGEPSVAAARFFPSVVPGAALVAVMFAWAWYRCGGVVAGLTAVFLLLWPTGIEVSQYVRFYALHGVIFVVAAILIFESLAPGRSRILRAGGLLIAAGLLVFAFRLQDITIVGTGAILLWVALYHGPLWLRAAPWLKWVVLAALAITAGVLVSGVLSETLEWAWSTFNWAPWPAHRDVTFYNRFFRDDYPTFWPLFPIAALAALAARFRLASFCFVLFGATFAVQSLGALKNVWYMYPTTPFFFLLWAIALAAILPALRGYLATTAGAAFGHFLPARALPAATWLALAVTVGFVLVTNVAVKRSVELAMGKDRAMLLGKPRIEWRDVGALTEPWLRDGALVVTTEEMQAVQWLGDFDLGFNRPRFSELSFMTGAADTPPFTSDPRTGRPLIGDLDDMVAVVECVPVGIVIANQPWEASTTALALSEAARMSGAEITLTGQDGLALFGWHRPPGPERDADACAAVPVTQDNGAALRILSGERGPETIRSAQDRR
jgi:hypothetical protein